MYGILRKHLSITLQSSSTNLCLVEALKPVEENHPFQLQLFQSNHETQVIKSIDIISKDCFFHKCVSSSSKDHDYLQSDFFYCNVYFLGYVCVWLKHSSQLRRTIPSSYNSSNQSMRHRSSKAQTLFPRIVFFSQIRL